jgi:DNA-binding MltR family transcriptional regulator
MSAWPVSTPGSVKSLRRYWKDKLFVRSPASILAELKGESDRALVILVAAVLDDLLNHTLARKMIFVPTAEQMDYIFRPDGPLGTFSSKIETAYLFGFIDHITRGQLDDIRELRNACAHSHQEISFTNAALANVAKRLFKPRGVVPLSSDSASDIREAFLQEFVILVRILGAGSREQGIALVKDDLRKVFFSDTPPSPGIPPRR